MRREQISPQLRLRIFAGPNGSGKSTIIKAVRDTTVEGRKVDFGYYINADDIARKLRERKFFFSSYRLKVKPSALRSFAEMSGLLNDIFTIDQFKKAFILRENRIHIKDDRAIERIAQIIARFLRSEMLRLKRRFSFETVFSHHSNLDIMREAKALGYKVYLYFVSTESPEINKYRVALRVKQGGHTVPEDRIESRYYRSLMLMAEAIGLSYQAFCFDNSKDNEPYRLVAHCKYYDEARVWDAIPEKDVSKWFNDYFDRKTV